MLRLSVSVDHVATVRQARRAAEPDPLQAALLAELAGAEGVSAHLRGDRRHVQEHDVELLRRVVKTRLNIDMATTQEMLRIALTVKPDRVTLVPERREELTTEGGLDAVLNSAQLRPLIKSLQEAGIQACLFVDPDLEQIKEGHRLGAEAVELNAAPYAEARGVEGTRSELRRVTDAAQLGAKLGLMVSAGHGLDYHNVEAVAAVGELTELKVGHAIVARAVLVGMQRAVGEMLERMRRGRRN